MSQDQDNKPKQQTTPTTYTKPQPPNQPEEPILDDKIIKGAKPEPADDKQEETTDAEKARKISDVPDGGDSNAEITDDKENQKPETTQDPDQNKKGGQDQKAQQNM